jgi:hypothetical protein
MEPITREEYYLAKIAGTYKGKTPEPVTIDEYYLATMAGDYSGNTPQPVTRLQYYMAKVAGVWGGSIPAPVTRLEYYWAAIASGEGKVFPPVTREEHFLVLVADAYSVVLTVVTGNPALLENSKGNRGLESLTLHGKSTQRSTTGAQLISLNDSYGVTTINGVTKTPIGISAWELEGISKENALFYPYSSQTFLSLSKGDYVFSVFGTSKAKARYTIVGGGSSGYIQTRQSQKISIQEDAKLTFNFLVENGVKSNGILMIMLNSGSTSLPWEPYTGGAPSPSPSYPQEIESAGQDGEIGIEVLGKNLIPFPYPLLGGAGTQIERNGVKYTVQSDGGIRCVGTPTAVTYINLSRIKFSNVGLTATQPTDGKIVLSGEKMTYDPSNYALFIYITSDQLGKPIDTVIYPQIELGTVATEYEPYKPAQTLIIPTPNGLPGIPVSSGGNYTDEKGQQWVCDTIEFRNGVAERVQRISKTIIDGDNVKFSESPSHSEFVNLTWYSAPGVASVRNTYMNAYFPSDFFSSNTNYDFIFTTSTRIMQYFETIKELNAFFAEKYVEGNPLTIFYTLRSPTRIPLTAEELAKLKALRTYSPTTTVINDAGTGMSVGYAKMK